MKLFTPIMLIITCCVSLNLMAKDQIEPVPGSEWKIPGIGMEFVWIKALDCWVGKYEVTNEEYRKFKPDHDSRSYETISLNGDRQPVVYVNFKDTAEYAKWLTEREHKAGRLPAGYCYRLPSNTEWTAFCQCGDNREYPWGNSMPPKYGNYNQMDDYNDGFPVTCPVEKSGKNDWGLYGVGGNASEYAGADYPFINLRGASWFDYYHDDLRSLHCVHDYYAIRYDFSGFRLVLSAHSIQE